MSCQGFCRPAGRRQGVGSGQAPWYARIVDHTMVKRRRLGSFGLSKVAALLLAAGQAACTFYTGEPNPTACAPATGGTSSGGAQAVGGMMSSAGEPGALSSEPWVNVTSNLAGLKSGCGNLGFVSNKPPENS